MPSSVGDAAPWRQSARFPLVRNPGASKSVAVTGEKTTVESIRARKGQAPVAALTAYDYPMAKLLDEAGIDVLLVGDSLGMVVLGYPDTTHVTLEEMLHHTRGRRRGRSREHCWAQTCRRTLTTRRKTPWRMPVIW